MQDEARCPAAPKGDFVLSVCERCGYIGNRAYDASLVTFDGYDISLEHSPVFRDYLQGLAERLVNRYGLHQKKILEIGVGKGLFLRKCWRAWTQPRGRVRPERLAVELRDQWRAEGVSIVPAFFSEMYATNGADMVSCRHVLDILDRPKQFLRVLAHSLQPSTVLYFESPNGDATLEDCVIWSMVYEHCSWFTAQGARALFNAAGFDILQIGSTFGKDYLGVEALPSPRGRAFRRGCRRGGGRPGEGSDLQAQAPGDHAAPASKLAAYAAAGKRGSIAWGAGARADRVSQRLRRDGRNPLCGGHEPKPAGKVPPRHGPTGRTASLRGRARANTSC